MIAQTARLDDSVSGQFTIAEIHSTGEGNHRNSSLSGRFRHGCNNFSSS